MCGAFFDAAHFREELNKLEEKIAQPGFWDDQEKAQGVLRERKRAEDQVSADKKLTSISGDIETYIDLAAQETNAAQREELQIGRASCRERV